MGVGSATNQPDAPQRRSALPAALVSEWDPSAAWCSRRRLEGWSALTSRRSSLTCASRGVTRGDAGWDYRRAEGGDGSMASDVNGPARSVGVRDERSSAGAVATALGDEGFEVAQVHDGRDALEVVGDVRPDLVVLDIMLPDLDGVTLLKRLRQDGVNVPVLFLTARDEPSDRVEGLVAGGGGYVPQPVTAAPGVGRVSPRQRPHP